MRRRLRFHFVGTLLLISHMADAFILLTASMDDVRRIAKKFVSESLADKITDIISKVSDKMETKLSEENEQNEDEFENISNESFGVSNPSNIGRQRFQTKSERLETEELVTEANSDTSKTFVEWDQEQMDKISKEEHMHTVDFDKPKPAYHDKDRLIDQEFENIGVHLNKQNNELLQDNSDHERENLRFDHKHEKKEYVHETEKPTNDFNEQSKEESKESKSNTDSENDIGLKKNIGLKRDIKPKKDIEPESDIEPKRDSRQKRKDKKIEKKKSKNSKKNRKPRKEIEKQNENESSSGEQIQDNSDGSSKVKLRQLDQLKTSEKSRYLTFKTTKNSHGTSDKPKEKSSIVKRPHYKLAESNEIKEKLLNIPFLKEIDEREYNEKGERRGNADMEYLLATSGPISLPKIDNKRIVKDTSEK